MTIETEAQAIIKRIDYQEIIDEIKAMCVENYDKGYGWTIIVECYDDADILELICEDDAKPTLGFLAEEVQGVFPELVGESENRGGHGSYLSLNYSGFGVLAVKAVQEQQVEIERLKQEKQGLAKQVESLEARLKRLEDAAVPKKYCHDI